MVKVILELPDTLIAQANSLGDATARNAENVLADTLALLWPAQFLSTAQNLPPISELSDQQVLTLAESKMKIEENNRLGDLQTKGKEQGLSDEEQQELLLLLHLYQQGQLRKSEALAEAVARKLRAPLSP